MRDCKSVAMETAARNLLSCMFDDYSSRWNVEVVGSTIHYCPEDHDKHESCSYCSIEINNVSDNQFIHKKRGTIYKVIGTGKLQVEDGVTLKDYDELIAYKDNDNNIWFRTPGEFNDGRFEKVSTNQENVNNRGMSDELIAALEKAREWLNNASPEEKEAMYLAQKRSFCREPVDSTDDIRTVYFKA